MTAPMRIRAQAQGANAVVRVLITHEMESGFRKDASGKMVPAWHVTEVTMQHNGKTVMTAQYGPAVSKNPLLQFVVKGAKAGDRIGIAWVDTKGERRSDEAIVG